MVDKYSIHLLEMVKVMNINGNFLLKSLAILCVIFGLSSQTMAEDPVYTTLFSNEAIEGYDTVSYFQGDGVPVKGSEDFATEWHGATWLFSSEANLNAFIADPEKYAPQYGGYCAWAVAQDSLAKGDPLIYEVVDDKLYLNFNERISNRWSPAKAELIPAGDQNYPNLVDF